MIERLLNATSRLNCINRIRAFGSSNSDLHAANLYGDACEKDLNVIFTSLNSILMQASTPVKIEVFLDRNNFDFDASISPLHDDRYLLVISIGCFASIDDWSGAIAPYFDISNPSLGKYRAAVLRDLDPNWHRRFSHYSAQNRKTFGTEAELEQLFGEFSLAGEQPVEKLISSTLIVWILLHEIGHVVLGHIDYRPSDLSPLSTKFAEFQMQDQATEDAENIRKCQEIEADFFSSICALSIFFAPYSSKGAGDSFISDGQRRLSFFTSTMVYLPLIIQKTRVLRGLTSSTHPSPLARLFNLLVSVEFAQQYIFGGIPLDESGDTAQPNEMIFRYFNAIEHIYFCSSIMKLPISNDIASQGGARLINPFLNDSDNNIRRREALKWILSLWHSRFQLNHFRPQEDPHYSISEWYSHFNDLGNELSARFRQSSNFSLGRDTLVGELVYATRRAPEMWANEAKFGLNDSDKVRKVLIDTLLICREFEQ